MHHMEGLSCAEISKVLGVPDGTVKGWASRGRAAMLDALTQGSPSAERIIAPTTRAVRRFQRAPLTMLAPLDASVKAWLKE